MATEPLLEVRNLTTGYGSTPILRGIDLAIQPGEIVAVIGRNGMGKTTMMRSLIGQLPGGSQIAGQAVAWLGGFLAGLLNGGVAFINLLSLVFLTPVVVFYLLRDWPRILAKLESLLPRDQAATIAVRTRKIAPDARRITRVRAASPSIQTPDRIAAGTMNPRL